MMAVQVLNAAPWDCVTDGHMVALRLRYDVASPTVFITPFCEVCHRVMLPSAHMEGPTADKLMRMVRDAAGSPDATPEQYEGIFETHSEEA